MVLPRNFARVPLTESPEVPSNTWATAFPKPVSRTLASLLPPAGSSTSTSSSKAAVFIPSTTISGPLTSDTRLYSIPEAVLGRDLHLHLSERGKLGHHLGLDGVEFV